MKRILIVDDIEENLYFLRILLEGHGYEVEEASNGSEALSKARVKVPDLVVSDISCRLWTDSPFAENGRPIRT
jgi:CheY-like chemotaxis protein